MSLDDETARANLARMRELMVLRQARERAYTAALIERENARRAYTALVARPGRLDPEAHRLARRALHEADVSLDAASRAVLQVKTDIDNARLDYEQHRRR